MLISYFCNAQQYVYAQTGQTTSKLQEANNAILRAFNATLDSEKAGGNVSSLLTQLNTAVQLLTEAETAYNAGNNATSAAKVEQAYIIAQAVQTQALSLKSASMTESSKSFWFTATISTVSSAVFIVALLFLWRKVKAAYAKSTLRLKPQASNNEA